MTRALASSIANRSGQILRGVSRSARELTIRTGLIPNRAPAYWFRGIQNFGDQLSPVIMNWASGVQPIWVSKRYRGKVLGGGSILNALASGDIVWGAGSIRDRPIAPPPDVTFLAVRGPLTRERILGDVPDVYGDPALLLPLYHFPPSTKRHAIGIVPHYLDYQAMSIEDPEILIVDVRQPWEVVVADIRSCDLIVSSSLHGLIVAEAYGIPASWIRVSDRVIGGDFKFNDYYLSTGRDATQPTLWRKGVVEAARQVAPPATFDPQKLLAAARRLSGAKA